MQQTINIFNEEVQKIKDAKDIVPAAVYQPLTTEMLAQFSKNGGNPLGLANGNTPLNSRTPSPDHSPMYLFLTSL